MLDRVDVPLLQALLIVCAGLSLFSLLLHGWDKWLARAGQWRVPERVLLLLALAGGWPGGWLGQRLFRHKLSKAAFLLRYRIAVTANLLVLAALLGRPLWRWLA